jgi:hypothetical protein
LWQADVNGGRSPYDYTWRQSFDVLGTSAQLFLNTGTEDFELMLEVEDADQGHAYDWKSVRVDPSAPLGIYCY